MDHLEHTDPQTRPTPATGATRRSASPPACSAAARSACWWRCHVHQRGYRRATTTPTTEVVVRTTPATDTPTEHRLSATDTRRSKTTAEQPGARIRELLQDLVDDGTITAAQADAVAEHLAANRPERGGPGRGHHPGFDGEVLAGLLGIDVDDAAHRAPCGQDDRRDRRRAGRRGADRDRRPRRRGSESHPSCRSTTVASRRRRPTPSWPRSRERITERRQRRAGRRPTEPTGDCDRARPACA